MQSVEGASHLYNSPILERLLGGEGANELLTDYRDRMVLAVMRNRRWNRSQAARDLKVHRNTIQRWLDGMKARGIEIKPAQWGGSHVSNPK